VREAKEAKEAEEAKERVERAGLIRHYTDLLVFQQAYRLALETSKLTRAFPREERYEMGRQVRSSSRSVASNIVEGWAKRHSAAEFKRHLQLAIGECEETRFWLSLAEEEGCVQKGHCKPLQVEYSQLGMMLFKLWKRWRKL
jgi:four helix bundle protein